MIRKIRNVLLYVLGWVVDMLLAGWLVIDRIYYRVFRGVTSYLYGGANYDSITVVRAVDRFLILILGLGWLVFMIVLEEYYRKASGNGTLLRKFLRVTGILILLVLVMDLIMAFLQNFALPWSVWLILTLELVLGVGGIWLGRMKKITPEENLD